MQTRKQANLELLRIVESYILSMPDMRFNQILDMLNILPQEEFYKEPQEQLKNIYNLEKHSQ